MDTSKLSGAEYEQLRRVTHGLGLDDADKLKMIVGLWQAAERRAEHYQGLYVIECDKRDPDPLTLFED